MDRCHMGHLWPTQILSIIKQHSNQNIFVTSSNQLTNVNVTFSVWAVIFFTSILLCFGLSVTHSRLYPCFGIALPRASRLAPSLLLGCIRARDGMIHQTFLCFYHNVIRALPLEETWHNTWASVNNKAPHWICKCNQGNCSLPVCCPMAKWESSCFI